MKQFLPNPHAPGCFWHDAAEKYGAPNLKWCEESLCSIISEPANTWSNLSYFIAFLVLYKWTRNLSGEHRYVPWAMLMMGSGSFLYHMSNNYFTQIIDFVGMFIFVIWLLSLNLRRLGLVGRKGSVVFYLSFMTLNTVAMHVMYLNHIPFQSLVALTVVLIVATEVIIYARSNPKYQYKFLFLGIVFVIIAETFSVLDITKVLCDPHNHFIQGHALWHVFSAFGLALGYRHWLKIDFNKLN